MKTVLVYWYATGFSVVIRLLVVVAISGIGGNAI